MKKACTKLKFNIAFHLQTDGQIKNMNKILNQCFRNYIVGDHKDWGNHPSLAKFCYNSTKHLASKMSHFELALEVEAKQPIDLTIPKKRGTIHEGDDEAKKMAKEYEERKTWAIKFLEKNACKLWKTSQQVA